MTLIILLCEVIRKVWLMKIDYFQLKEQKIQALLIIQKIRIIIIKYKRENKLDNNKYKIKTFFVIYM